jgi:hypothetical protein
MKTIIQIVLVIAILVLSYIFYRNIAKPIEFQKERDYKYGFVIDRLKDIRTAQVAFKDVYGRYTGSFDTLIHFLKNDSLPVVRSIGSVPDTLTEKQALELKLITRDTIRIPVMDTIFKAIYPVDSIRYVPFTQTEFKLAAGEVETGSKVKVKVFECSDAKPFDANKILKVGSLTEANNNAGNWEK